MENTKKNVLAIVLFRVFPAAAGCFRDSLFFNFFNAPFRRRHLMENVHQ